MTQSNDSIDVTFTTKDGDLEVSISFSAELRLVNPNTSRTGPANTTKLTTLPPHLWWMHMNLNMSVNINASSLRNLSTKELQALVSHTAENLQNPVFRAIFEAAVAELRRREKEKEEEDKKKKNKLDEKRSKKG